VRGDRQALDAPSIAVVGARRASAYGLEVARALGRSLAAAGVVVTSGMALGIDSAAHVGALEAGRTVAVLAGGADVPYPAGKRQLHGRIGAVGAVVSEMPPGTPVRRWAFVARNRIIAALGVATVLVEAAERSGSLTTADFALALGRPVGAVPGLVTAPNAAGTNALIQAGAALVRDAADALDLAALDGVVVPPAPAGAGVPDELRPVLAAVEAGRATATAIADGTGDVGRVLEQLTELELRGLVRRSFGGRYVRAAG
jgi:DNA processing protein